MEKGLAWLYELPPVYLKIFMYLKFMKPY